VSAEPSVVVVIPTFAPPRQLPSLVSAIRESGYPIVVSDDASPCTSDAVLREVASIPNVDVLRHARNAGIARGLNEGLSVAQLAEAHWLLTVDQDTMIATNYLQELLDSASARLQDGEPLGAIGAEVIEDASGPMTYPLSAAHPNATTQEIIQTGTLWNAAAMHQVGGFDESMGMDAVDAAACLALRRAGFTIGVAPGLSVDHTIGRSQAVRLGQRTVMVTGHSPDRRASMLRSRIRLLPAEFAESPRHAMRTIRRVAVNQTLGLVLEGQRWEKAKGTARGLLPRKTR